MSFARTQLSTVTSVRLKPVTPLSQVKQSTTGPLCSLFACGNMIRYDPTLVDLTSNFFVLCTYVKVYLMNYS